VPLFAAAEVCGEMGWLMQAVTAGTSVTHVSRQPMHLVHSQTVAGGSSFFAGGTGAVRSLRAAITFGEKVKGLTFAMPAAWRPQF
jgi:hypothetical protein